MENERRFTCRAVLRAAGAATLLAGTLACGPIMGSAPTPTHTVSPTALPGPTRIPSPTPTSGLRVRVEELTAGGVQELTPAPTVTPHPPQAWEFLVRVSRQGDSRRVVAEATAIGSGWLDFRVPADRYWVFLPAGSQKVLDRVDGGAAVRMPDYTLAYAWSAAVVPDAGVVDVTLVYWYLQS